MPEDPNVTNPTANQPGIADGDAKDSNTANQPGIADAAAAKQPDTFTREQLDSLLAKQRREQQKAFEKQLADAKLTTEELQKQEISALRKQLRDKEVIDKASVYAKKLNCVNPTAAAKYARQFIQYDAKTDEPLNLKEALEATRDECPELFQPRRPGSGDGSAGVGTGGASGQQPGLASFDQMLRRASGREG